MFQPLSTYRIQFHKQFSFESFQAVLPYLKKLGVETVYASPIFTASPGSMHGYDGIDPHHINPEIGTLDQFNTIVEHLKQSKMHWLQDIVPNHMAFHNENGWLTDVMEKGIYSKYANYFDLSFSTSLFKGPLMVPFLGEDLEEVLNKGAISIGFQNDRFLLFSNDQVYPIGPSCYKKIVLFSEDGLPATISKTINEIPVLGESENFDQDWDHWRRNFSVLMQDTILHEFVQQNLNKINSNKTALATLLSEQNYRLCKWTESDERINYRRFFTVNSLICLNIQNQVVFDDYHLFIKQMVEQDKFQGLRIDHIDGLYNPVEYLNSLRRLCGEEIYIVVEKILEPGEKLAERWPVEGNTGYDFLGLVNNLLTNPSSASVFKEFYQQLTQDPRTPGEQVLEKKNYILNTHMRGELENLFRLFAELQLADANGLQKAGSQSVKKAIGLFLIHCPVYRFYIDCFPLSESQQNAFVSIFNDMLRCNPELEAAIELLHNVFLPKSLSDPSADTSILLFLQRCMQFTGPLMAKGVEDTLMYTYNKFIGHNEVGDAPDAFGITTEQFHEKMSERQQLWPISLNTTATHDTKRGEDLRARLNVLTDLADEWIEKVKSWELFNQGYKTNGYPDRNDEYFIYQTICGCFPMPGQEEEDFEERLQAYIIKSLREAKARSNWASPNTSYENATVSFIKKILEKSQPFFKSFKDFHYRIAKWGVINSLIQVALKFTLPGVPDTYQGGELWDFNLVDPDNRRPVDYQKRERLLNHIIENKNSVFGDLWKEKFNPALKLWLTYNCLHLKKTNPNLFSEGNYNALQVQGRYSKNILAFSRKHGSVGCIVIVPLSVSIICKEQHCEIESLDWKDTKVLLPAQAEAEWDNVLLNEKYVFRDHIVIQQVMQPFPILILKGKFKKNDRSAGILMHITSLPSPFGTGDLGKEAKIFVDFLYSHNQRCWQVLPVNPTSEGQGFSPYSSYSSTAGNPLLISPELLNDWGLLSSAELESYRQPLTGKTDFKYAEKIRNLFFENAWQRFKQGTFLALEKEFNEFKEKESYWLDSFAFYIVLKEMHDGKPWYQWEEIYKFFNPTILSALAADKAEQINKIKWIQAIFNLQWKELKIYCQQRGIALIGDIPFYLSHDAADVWANRQYFDLDPEGNQLGMAGVPPDFFSQKGQLWGMPVFNWQALKENNYSWWIQRLRRNFDLFDIVRLDHFRAFAAYWRVAAPASSAENGSWQGGPGAEFFETLLKEFKNLPLIAEDLGEIDPSVNDLRDRFHLPGMKVLQFAFGAEQNISPHIPHNFHQNFIVYTGTHDNNTTRGWYRLEKHKVHHPLSTYLNKEVSEITVADELGRLAYSSVGQTVILPMQDILKLDEEARMNIPSTAKNNWTWQLKPGELEGIEHLRHWVNLYNRNY
ncbi:MAG: hypothetical protein NVS1B13_11980 [Flavisolibacter sp.]